MRKNRLSFVFSSALLGLLAAPFAASANHEYCREYTKQIIVGNRIEQGYGVSCLQPDGSWKIQSEAIAPPPAASATQVVYVQQPPIETVRYVPTTRYVTVREPAPFFSISFGEDRYRHHHHHRRHHHWGGHHHKHGHGYNHGHKHRRHHARHHRD
jgi:hypothetical protein